MDLQSFFKQNNKVALAFSGGVDSSYLFYAAINYGAIVQAYYVKSVFQPEFELEDALHLAKTLNSNIKILETDILSEPLVAQNPINRCYHCKKIIFSMIMKAAYKDGFQTLIDGTNASDDAKSRMGMQALKEFSVRSPLRECNLTKTEIRKLSKETNLFTWNKPAYACLATRIPTGTEITKEKLYKTEIAENYLFSLGFSDFRIRLLEDTAKIQVPLSQMQKVIENREKIVAELKKYYNSVLMDLEVR